MKLIDKVIGRARSGLQGRARPKGFGISRQKCTFFGPDLRAQTHLTCKPMAKMKSLWVTFKDV